MKSLEIICFTGNSGLTDYAVSLARAVGARARLVTAQSLEPRFREMGFAVETPFRRSRHFPLDVLRFAAGLLRRRPAWTLWQGPLKLALLDGLLVRALRAAGLRCAITIHDVLPHVPQPWSRWTYGFYYRSFERVIVHSNAALDGARALGVRAPALVVPHGVYDLFCLSGLDRAAARARIPGLASLPAGTPVALFFGHLEARKGLFALLAVARRLHERGSPLRFLIAGAPSLSGAEQQRFASECAALPNVLLQPRRIPFEEVESCFAAADLVLLPYQEGTTSGVLKLAIAFQRPVLASAVGDLPEEIPASAGLTVPLGADFVPRLAEALQQMLADPQRWAAGMAAAGERLQWPAIAARIEAFLDSKDGHA